VNKTSTIGNHRHYWSDIVYYWNRGCDTGSRTVSLVEGSSGDGHQSFSVSGNTAYAGAHSHDLPNIPSSNRTYDIHGLSMGSHSHTVAVEGGHRHDLPLLPESSVSLPVSGITIPGHSHGVTVHSRDLGQTAAPVSRRPRSLLVNAFVYLVG